MLNPRRERLETVRRRAHGLEGVTPGAGTASAAADGAPVQGVAPVSDFDGPSRGVVHAPSGPDAVVLSCLGGSQGDLGVVRALGRCGVRVVLVSEGDGAASALSRYVVEHHRIPSFSDGPAVLRVLESIADSRKGAGRPVLFPTADPDLDFVTRYRERLSRRFGLVNPPPSIVEPCLDKSRFFGFATEHGFPIPETWSPANAEEVRQIGRSARFPLILKPSFPPSWSREPLATELRNKKALTLDTPAELQDWYGRIAAIDPKLVIQDYVPGRDDRLYSLHVYMDRTSQPLAWFTGRKLRTYPTYAGIGCFVESVVAPEIIEAGLSMLRRVGYTGMALLQFKRDDRDGSFKLLEINPRSSSWNQLAAACGVNLPYVAYLDAIGRPAALPPVQRVGVKYLFLENDFLAFLDYRRHGDISTWQWIRSLAGPKVYQLFATDDLRPFVHDLGAKAGRLWRKAGRTLSVHRTRPRAR
jgi:predicted ATP-grasp superfamily ATP-dependent carboligase